LEQRMTNEQASPAFEIRLQTLTSLHQPVSIEDLDRLARGMTGFPRHKAIDNLVDKTRTLTVEQLLSVIAKEERYPALLRAAALRWLVRWTLGPGLMTCPTARRQTRARYGV
jgi:hypothetical protein